MSFSDLVRIGFRDLLSRKLLGFATFSLAAFAFQFAAPQFLCAADVDKAESAGIVIRPANYDPADELAYTRDAGELKPGAVANGKFWNKPADDDSRAAVSGTAPAPAKAQGPGVPVSAASGTPAPRMMTYSEAYAQIPFSRTEYEANPNYRHDAALELMFGAMRPMIMTRTTTPYFSRYPDMFRYRFPVYPYQSSLGGNSTNTNMYWNTNLYAQ